MSSSTRILVTCKTCGQTLFDQLKDVGEVISSTLRMVRSLTEEELLKEILNVDIVVAGTDPYTRAVIERGAASRLKMIARYGAGIDNIDLKAATENKVLVTFAPKASSNSVAEFAVGAMLTLLKRIREADALVRAGRWSQQSARGTELHGKTVGVIGLGTIGERVSDILERMGVTILAYDPYLEDDPRLTDLDTLLRNSDIITIHSALTPTSKHLIGQREISLMKNQAIIVNTARGGVIDEKELFLALVGKRLGGAALDVFEREPPALADTFARLPNVILTPHIAGNTEEASRRMDHVIAEDSAAFIQGRRPTYPANPEVLEVIGLR